jgi:hypothetical protein
MITLEGERELYAKIEQTTQETLKAARRGLREGGMAIVADAKDNLRGNHSVVSGNLRASGKVQAVEGDENAIDAGFFAQGSNQGYAYFVEYGRRAGKMPPVDMLMEWMRKRTSKSRALKSALAHIEGRRVRRESAYTKDYLLRSAAWGLAKWIAKNGTRPHPFFAPAVEKNKADIEKAISNAVKEEL